MFTTENTDGYTATELAALNTELAAIIAAIPAENVEGRIAAEQAFSDEVARR